jgi:hypothetical protein
MGAAVVAALAALGGVALGQLLNLWGESTKWLREHRSIAYAAFLGAAERYLSGVLVAKGAGDFRASEQGRELDRIFGDVQVFGSDAAYSSAQDVRTKLIQLHNVLPAQDTNGTSDQAFEVLAEPIVHDCRMSIDKLRSVMKRELGVKK